MRVRREKGVEGDTAATRDPVERIAERDHHALAAGPSLR